MDVPYQHGERYIERIGDLLHVQYRDVLFSSLDHSDVGSVQATTICKLLLRVTSLKPEFTHSIPEVDQGFRLHAGQV